MRAPPTRLARVLLPTSYSRNRQRRCSRPDLASDLHKGHDSALSRRQEAASWTTRSVAFCPRTQSVTLRFDRGQRSLRDACVPNIEREARSVREWLARACQVRPTTDLPSARVKCSISLRVGVSPAIIAQLACLAACSIDRWRGLPLSCWRRDWCAAHVLGRTNGRCETTWKRLTSDLLPLPLARTRGGC